jgi:hypothetical protein
VRTGDCYTFVHVNVHKCIDKPLSHHLLSFLNFVYGLQMAYPLLEEIRGQMPVARPWLPTRSSSRKWVAGSERWRRVAAGRMPARP